MKSILIALFFISSVIMLKAAGSIKEISETASALYHEEKYAEALDLWYKLENSGNTDPNLYFNIGSAESLLGHKPESILAFEKARRLRPWDEHINDAIRKERGAIEHAIIPVQPFFLLEWYKNFLAIFRPGSWTLFGLVVLFFAVVQWLAREKRSDMFALRMQVKIRYFIVVGGLLIISGILSYSQLHRSDEAVVMTLCDCRKAASAESPATRVLDPGEKVQLTDRISDWNKIRLLNLDECWIQSGCLKTISIGVR